MRGILLTILIVFGSLQVAAQTNRAFIVGVGDYSELEDLDKTLGDVEGYSDIFENALDFEVTTVTDPTHRDFLNSFSLFVESIEEGDQVAFVFSGHGWSNGAQNFLALSDAPLETTELALKNMTASWEMDILSELNARNPGFVLGVIDACRDNPFDLNTRSVLRGLVPQQDISPGSMVIYSAGANQTALDSLGDDDTSPYSVFTRNLLPKLSQPDQPLMLIADKARTETVELALRNSHAQRPAVYADVSLDFCLSGSCADVYAQAREFKNSWDNIDEDDLRQVRTNSQELLSLALMRHPLQEIIDAADRGSARAAYLAGRSFYTPTDGNSPDYLKAQHYFRSGCELGFGPSCTNYAVVQLFSSLYGFELILSEADLDQARTLLRRECTDGDMTACLSAGTLGVSVPFDAAQITVAIENLNMRCRNGLRDFCGSLRNYLEGLRNHEEQYRLAFEGLIESCDWGLTGSCYAVASELIGYDREKGVLSKYRDRAYEFAKRSCRTRETEDSVGCEVLAADYQYGVGIDQDLAEAERLRLRSCELEFATSCRNLAVDYHNGLYGGNRKRLARQFHQKACELGEQYSCSVIR